MKEFSSLFISGYLIASVLMVPLMGFYLSLSLKRVSFRLLLHTHKVIILLSIILPVSMVAISYSGNSGKDLSIRSEIDRAPITVELEVISSGIAVPDDSPASGIVVGRLPTLQDVVYYFVDLILFFSILGLLTFTLRYALQTWRIRRIKKESWVSTINGNCHLIESMEVTAPFSAGILRKNIFIPRDVSESDKQVIIQHELNHFRCHHHLWSLMEGVLACVFWFNPFSHILRRHGAFLRELECDGRTIQVIDRYAYTRLLLDTAEIITAGGGNSRFSLLTQGWARKGELRRRIETLMRRDDMKKKKVIGGFVAVGIVITVCITLFYGNLNDLTKAAILTDINVKYGQMAPVSARVDLESVPPHFINALLVQEDSEFFEHDGIRLKSILRAAGANLKSFLSGGPLYKQGASTITQQLAKQFLGDWERTMKRKFEELKIARVLENSFSKEEILEMYLNVIYFGNDANGLKAASEKYFGHDYARLTLSESAMLVPFIDAPSKYNVLKAPDTAKKRQEYLLGRIAAADPNIKSRSDAK